MAPNSGPGLLFLTIPTLLDQLPFGYIFGLAFFLLVIIGAITTGVGLIETLAANVAELFDLKRKASVWIIISVTFVMAIPSILSQGPWSNVQLFGMDIFGLIDYVSGNILLTLGGLLISLYVVFQWTFKRFMNDINTGTVSMKLSSAWKPVISYLIPLSIAIILITGLM